MKRIIDLFGNEAPTWLSAMMMESTPELQNTIYEYFTLKQSLQLGRYPCSFDSTLLQFDRHPFLMLRPHRGSELDAVCLAHARTCCRVSRIKGDVEPETDLSTPFLSCRGVSLTRNRAALMRLDLVQKRKQYTSRFWISPTDLKHYSKLEVSSMLDLKSMDSTALEKLFNCDDVSVQVVNDRNHTCRVVNLAEIQKGRPSGRANRSAFHLFRHFAPLNVRTSKPFEHSIEDHLRWESFNSRCWCSIWGTLHDFEACSIKPLKGALGVYLMDSMGNEIFLINALCTEDPVGAFCKLYPYKFITFN